MTEVNAFDLAFVVDTTGSMGHLIQAAQRQMIAMIDEVKRAADVSLRLAVVEYRDHPPQDQLVARAHAFTDDMKSAQATISGLKAAGGGDAPEAVLDGLVAACRELAWRPHARRVAVLVGDAPPHGTGLRGDGFPRGCPCGETIDSVTARAEEARVTLYALGLTREVTESFGRLSRATGGAYFEAGQGEACLERLKALLADEFGHLDLDRRVLAERAADRSASVDALAARLAVGWPVVATALSRLGSRGLLQP
jgi:Mg-chelatase subunit ChlD